MCTVTVEKRTVRVIKWIRITVKSSRSNFRRKINLAPVETIEGSHFHCAYSDTKRTYKINKNT